MDFPTARRNMVDCQILPNNVDDERIIEAFLEVPKEVFVPDNLSGIAYVDDSVPLGDGRCIMEAMIIARLLQVASLKRADVALSVGCGTGYAVAILAKIVDTVVAVETDKVLARKAIENLAAIGLNNVAVIQGGLAEGNPDQGPYDVIFFDGSVEIVPTKICDQLAENGRLVVILNESGVSKACIYTHLGGIISKREVFDAGTPSLPGFEREKGFVF